jgi:[ribosomal protein S18]-alanine N-acetyltransferase
MSPCVTVRKMEEHDLDEVLAIEASSSLTPWSRPLFLEEMAHVHGHCFSLTLPGDPGPRIVAYLCFRTVGDESELLNLAVHPDHRRKGFARHLMAFYIDVCHREKVKISFLDVHTGNQAALQLYRSLGYRATGKRTRFYLGQLDALTMEREIERNRGRE